MDISGVLHDGTAAIPGAIDAVSRLRDAGLPVRFVTNTTRRSKRRLIAQLEGFGFKIEPREVFTPVAAARAWLSENGYVPHLLVHPGLDEDFADCGSDGPVAVVIGDAADRITYATMNSAFRALEKGAPLLALADNRFFKDTDGDLSLDAGPFVKALEFASGKQAIRFGKPSPELFLRVVASMGCMPAETAMVGDDAENDVAGAIAAGIGTGILVRTGKYREGDEKNVDPKPSMVVDDIGAAIGFMLKDR